MLGDILWPSTVSAAGIQCMWYVLEQDIHIAPFLPADKWTETIKNSGSLNCDRQLSHPREIIALSVTSLHDDPKGLRHTCFNSTSHISYYVQCQKKLLFLLKKTVF